MLESEGTRQESLLPHWVTFAGSMLCCMGTVVALMATTARGTQTPGEGGDQPPNRCRAMRALCNFMCTRPTAMSWWKAGLLRICLLGMATLFSTALSLLITNVTSNDSEPIRDTIRIIIGEMLGIEDEGTGREKREADCFDTNNSALRCPQLTSTITAPVCNFANLLETQVDTIFPPTCTMLVTLILFATGAALLLSVSAVTTIICHHVRAKLPRRLRLPTTTPASPDVEHGSFGTPDTEDGRKTETEDGRASEAAGNSVSEAPGNSDSEADTETDTAGNIEARAEGGTAGVEQGKDGDKEEDPVPWQEISPA